MITYIGAEKAFNEVQHAFMIIVRELLGLMSQWAYLKTITNTKKTESMYFKIRNEITMPGFYSLIQQYVQHSYLLITTFFYLDHHLGENLF